MASNERDKNERAAWMIYRLFVQTTDQEPPQPERFAAIKAKVARAARAWSSCLECGVTAPTLHWLTQGNPLPAVVAGPLATQLRGLARWLGLSDVAVAERGSLGRALGRQIDTIGEMT